MANCIGKYSNVNAIKQAVKDGETFSPFVAYTVQEGTCHFNDYTADASNCN